MPAVHEDECRDGAPMAFGFVPNQLVCLNGLSLIVVHALVVKFNDAIEYDELLSTEPVQSSKNGGSHGGDIGLKGMFGVCHANMAISPRSPSATITAFNTISDVLASAHQPGGRRTNRRLRP